MVLKNSMKAIIISMSAKSFGWFKKNMFSPCNSHECQWDTWPNLQMRIFNNRTRRNTGFVYWPYNLVKTKERGNPRFTLTWFDWIILWLGYKFLDCCGSSGRQGQHLRECRNGSLARLSWVKRNQNLCKSFDSSCTVKYLRDSKSKGIIMTGTVAYSECR